MSDVSAKIRNKPNRSHRSKEKIKLKHRGRSSLCELAITVLHVLSIKFSYIDVSFQLTKRILENKTTEDEIAKLLEDTKSKEVGIRTPQVMYGMLVY